MWRIIIRAPKKYFGGVEKRLRSYGRHFQKLVLIDPTWLWQAKIKGKGQLKAIIKLISQIYLYPIKRWRRGKNSSLPPLRKGRRVLIINTIVLSSPDVAAGTILLSRQAACVPRRKDSIRPGHLPVGLDSSLLLLKGLIFTGCDPTAIHTLN